MKNEIQTVFNRPKFINLLDTATAQNSLNRYLQKVKTVNLEQKHAIQAAQACPDPKDTVFLALARQVHAGFSVTLDNKDLLSLTEWQGILIERPITICEIV